MGQKTGRETKGGELSKERGNWNNNDLYKKNVCSVQRKEHDSEIKSDRKEQS